MTVSGGSGGVRGGRMVRERTDSPDQSSGERRLPMAGSEAGAVGGAVSGGSEEGRGPAGGPGSGVAPFDPVDPERIRAGWQHRFVTAGARAEEMIALYRELGFEVAADPVVTGGMIEGCATCFGGSAEEYRSIYTRRPARGLRESESVPRCSGPLQ